jgi:hypothetical protein
MRYFILALSIALIINGCEKNSNPVASVTKYGDIYYQYVPGEVSVSFIDTLNYNFIRSFINELNVSVISISADSAFEMQIRIDSGSVNKYIELFSNDSSVIWAAQGSSYPYDSPNPFIMVRFKGSYSIQYAFDLIRSIPGLTWIKTWYSEKYALLKVPIGQEQHWINILKTYPFVTDATFLINSIAHPA